MSDWYEITLDGCDDSTTVRIQLPYDVAKWFIRVAEMTSETSTYSCMPEMVVMRIENNDDSYTHDDAQRDLSRLALSEEYGYTRAELRSASDRLAAYIEELKAERDDAESERIEAVKRYERAEERCLELAAERDEAQEQVAILQGEYDCHTLIIERLRAERDEALAELIRKPIPFGIVDIDDEDFERMCQDRDRWMRTAEKYKAERDEWREKSDLFERTYREWEATARVLAGELDRRVPQLGMADWLTWAREQVATTPANQHDEIASELNMSEIPTGSNSSEIPNGCCDENLGQSEQSPSISSHQPYHIDWRPTMPPETLLSGHMMLYAEDNRSDSDNTEQVKP